MKITGRYFGIAAFALGIGAWVAPAHALTVWEAPKGSSDSAQRFADPDQAQNFSSDSNGSNQQRSGWNFEFGAAPRQRTQDSRFSDIPGFQPFVPGPPQIPGSPHPTR